MRVLSWCITILLASAASAFAQDIDFEKLAPKETAEVAKCFSDTLVVIEKHQLVPSIDVFEVACAVEIEGLQKAVSTELVKKPPTISNPAVDEYLNRQLASAVVWNMMDKASELYKKQPLAACSGTGCSLDDYRTCLMRRMPTAIKAQSKPLEFESRAQEECEDFESAARSALTNDFGNVLRRHLHGFGHEMSELISGIIVGIRHNVVVMYGEDLLKVQPGRRSCKPEMCGASPCVSLSGKAPTEYECAVNQK